VFGSIVLLIILVCLILKFARKRQTIQTTQQQQTNVTATAQRSRTQQPETSINTTTDNNNRTANLTLQNALVEINENNIIINENINNNDLKREKIVVKGVPENNIPCMIEPRERPKELYRIPSHEMMVKINITQSMKQKLG
jgi:hypothetical protein